MKFTSIEQIEKYWRDKVKGLNLYLVDNKRDNSIIIDNIVVPKENRKQGIGSEIIKSITDYADQNNKMVELTPALKDDRKGTTSRNRLVKFYKQFGFYENKGRNKDFRLSSYKMYRKPKVTAMFKITAQEKQLILKYRIKAISNDTYYRCTQKELLFASNFTRGIILKINKDDKETQEKLKVLPKEVVDLFNKGKINRIHFLSPNIKFKKQTKYFGMSNWGLGVYFAPELSFARRYGDYVFGVKIDPKYIIEIDAMDFADTKENTNGGKLRIELEKVAGEDMGEQSKHFKDVVKKLFGKNKQALLVKDLQLVVYNPNIIKPLFYFAIEP